MESIKITLPFPVSNNALFGNRGGQQRFKSQKYKEWLISCPELDKLNLIGPLHIHYRFYWPCSRARDGQNYFKGITDYLVSSGVIQDDNWRIIASESWNHGGVVKKHLARVEIEISPQNPESHAFP